jgi:hypothetical protein
MSFRRPMAFTFFGFFFLIIGILTVLGTIALWHFESVFSWQYSLYALMNFVLSYGFFSMHYWLLPALALNWAAGIVLTVVKLYMHTPTAISSVRYILSISLASLVLYAVYAWPKKKFLHTTRAHYAAIIFFASWLAVTCYTVTSTIT